MASHQHAELSDWMRIRKTQIRLKGCLTLNECWGLQVPKIAQSVWMDVIPSSPFPRLTRWMESNWSFRSVGKEFGLHSPFEYCAWRKYITSSDNANSPPPRRTSPAPIQNTSRPSDDEKRKKNSSTIEGFKIFVPKVTSLFARTRFFRFRGLWFRASPMGVLRLPWNLLLRLSSPI